MHIFIYKETIGIAQAVSHCQCFHMRHLTENTVFCASSLLHALGYKRKKERREKSGVRWGIPHDDRCFSMKYYTRRNHTYVAVR